MIGREKEREKGGSTYPLEEDEDEDEEDEDDEEEEEALRENGGLEISTTPGRKR